MRLLRSLLERYREWKEWRAVRRGEMFICTHARCKDLQPPPDEPPDLEARRAHRITAPVERRQPWTVVRRVS